MSKLDGTWKLDPTHSEVGFTVRHAGISKVRGRFADVESTVKHHGGEALVRTEIRTDSFTTGNADRDAHVKSPDFLDVQQYPVASFSGTYDEEEEKLVGEFTLHGVTKEVELDVEVSDLAKDPFGNVRVGVEARGKLNRKDFGLTWNAALETGGVLVSEKVNLTLDLSFVREEAE